MPPAASLTRQPAEENTATLNSHDHWSRESGSKVEMQLLLPLTLNPFPSQRPPSQGARLVSAGGTESLGKPTLPT